MSVMPRLRTLFLILSLGVLLSSAYAQTDYRDQRLHDQYLGKTFLLRGFYSDAHLKFDDSGNPVGRATPGDWTIDGFVLVSSIRVKGSKLAIAARREDADSFDDMLQLRLAETGGPGHERKPLMVEIEADLGQHNPSAEQAEAALAKIFLTAQDDFVGMVPDYWKSCLTSGLMGKDKCRFAPELLAVPGFSHSRAENSETASTSGDSGDAAPIQILRAKSGVTPPRVIFQREPEFSERARQEKFQGIVVLSVAIGKEGVPTRVRIVTPLGCGLDAKAVEAVRTWTFKPAEKDGQPVPAEIMVEVSFRLY